MLHQWFQETHTQFWDQKPKRRDLEGPETPYRKLPFQLWNVSKYGSCADAAITGIMPPPLMELQVQTMPLILLMYGWFLYKLC